MPRREVWFRSLKSCAFWTLCSLLEQPQQLTGAWVCNFGFFYTKQRRCEGPSPVADSAQLHKGCVCAQAGWKGLHLPDAKGKASSERGVGGWVGSGGGSPQPAGSVLGKDRLCVLSRGLRPRFAMPHGSGTLRRCRWGRALLAFRPHRARRLTAFKKKTPKPIAASHSLHRAVWFGAFPKPLRRLLQDTHTYQRLQTPPALFSRGDRISRHSPVSSSALSGSGRDLAARCNGILSFPASQGRRIDLFYQKLNNPLLFIESTGLMVNRMFPEALGTLFQFHRGVKPLPAPCNSTLMSGEKLSRCWRRQRRRDESLIVPCR